MIRTSKYFLGFLIVLVAGAVWQVQAHQQKESITTILFNERTGNVEVAHRFYIHDAEHAIKQILGKQADLIKQSQTQSAFAQYVQKRFSLQFNSDSPLILELLGQEVKGKFFWVYQEVKYAQIPQRVSVKFDALMDIWPAQRNIINVEGIDTEKSRSVALLSNQTQKTINL
ncbi:hypothetical protein FLL45_22395 [Aliikangiella marina]|uniref:Orphan protein n=1 Tax=Aliikangiella marina TaxID=1712262 RepID=A0A545T1J0_9GAMM|nr:DUF6702 family protein [Aliikangiella marina]TQV71080.1 hypothetical protein FLL45_22395 [Aliikangiella marina]